MNMLQSDTNLFGLCSAALPTGHLDLQIGTGQCKPESPNLRLFSAASATGKLLLSCPLVANHCLLLHQTDQSLPNFESGRHHSDASISTFTQFPWPLQGN